MNIEEARRALLRREEDMAWMRLVQAFHRDRGDVLRALQRRHEAARQAHNQELRDAQMAFEESRAMRRRELEDADARERAEARARDEAEQQQAKTKAERKREKRLAAEAQRLADVEAQEARRAERLAANREREARARRETVERFHHHRAEFSRSQQAHTPAPLSSSGFLPGLSSSTTRSNTGASTPDFSPRRAIVQQKDLEEAAMDAKAAERSRIEMRRLENLLALRKREAREQKAAEAERQRLDAIAKARAEEIERAAFEEQRRHVETVMSIDRDRSKRLNKRVLVPVTGPDGEASYHTTTEERLKTAEQLKTALQLEREAEERRRETDAERRRAQKEHEKLLSMKSSVNISKERERRRAAREQRDAVYRADLEEARKAREQEEAAARDIVLLTKAEQRRQEDAVAAAAAERQRAAAIQALEMKLESAKLAEQMEARSLEGFKERMAEANRLSTNRKTARQLAEERRRQQQRQTDAIVAEHLRARQEAQQAVAAATKAKIEAAAQRHHLEAQDKDAFRQRQQRERERLLASTEVFYREGDGKPKKPRVPAQTTTASAPVHLPPHPELASMEMEAAKRFAAVESDLAAVDNRMRQLATRL